jgi:hypothetical protein
MVSRRFETNPSNPNSQAAPEQVRADLARFERQSWIKNKNRRHTAMPRLKEAFS